MPVLIFFVIWSSFSYICFYFVFQGKSENHVSVPCAEITEKIQNLVWCWRRIEWCDLIRAHTWDRWFCVGFSVVWHLSQTKRTTKKIMRCEIASFDITGFVFFLHAMTIGAGHIQGTPDMTQALVPHNGHFLATERYHTIVCGISVSRGLAPGLMYHLLSPRTILSNQNKQTNKHKTILLSEDAYTNL